MANEEDARDIAQESLTRLLRYRETEPASSWKPLLYRIATNVMGEQFRRASARQATRHVPLEGMEIASGAPAPEDLIEQQQRSGEHTSELQSLMRISYAVFCLKKKKRKQKKQGYT